MHHLKKSLSIALLLAAAWPVMAEKPAATRPAAIADTRPVPPMAVTPDMKTQFWFGVAVENIPPNIARQLKLKPNQGLMIAEVFQDSPAEKAGLVCDDLLIAINGRPLTSQDELFKAANPHAKDKAVIEGVAPSSTLTYMRGGDKFEVQITPTARPPRMMVFTSADAHGTHGIRTYVMPNGGAAEVGTGYRMPLHGGDPSDFTANSIKQIVAKGQTIVLSQETDIDGNIKNTITVGPTVYTVDPAHLETLPADLRPLARKLIDGAPPAATASGSQPAALKNGQLEEHIKELERQNAELTKKLDDALKREQEHK